MSSNCLEYNIDARNEYGETSLMLSRSPKMTKLLIEAAGVNARAYVNARSYDGFTALMFSRSLEQSKLLIEAGANVDLVNNDGWTALMYTESEDQRNHLIKSSLSFTSKLSSICS